MFNKQKINESEILKFGFLGGTCQALYIFLVVLGLNVLGKNFNNQPPDLLGSMLILMIFVFSAGVSGILVFGYPTYLAFQKKFVEALMTAIFSLATIAITGILVFVWLLIV